LAYLEEWQYLDDVQGQAALWTDHQEQGSDQGTCHRLLQGRQHSLSSKRGMDGGDVRYRADELQPMVDPLYHEGVQRMLSRDKAVKKGSVKIRSFMLRFWAWRQDIKRRVLIWLLGG